MRGVAVLALVVILLATACATKESGGKGDDPHETVSVATPQETTTVPTAADPEPAHSAGEGGSEGTEPPGGAVMTQPLKGGIVKPILPVDPHEGGPVAAAIANLALRLVVGEPAIEVLLVEDVVWPNSAMGCEQPGMKYAQTPTDGMRIVLVHAGVEYAYHSGGSTGLFLCTPHLVKEPVLPKIDITEGTVSTVPGTGTGETAPTEEAGGPGDPDV